MSEVLLSLSFAYVFLAALLLLTLIFSRLAWVFKVALVIVALGFYWLSYQGWKESQGWPTAADIPDRFLLHYAVIEEPDEELGVKGGIFIWLSDLKNLEIAEEPRAYRLEYTQQTHGKVSEAIREIQNGGLQLGITNPQSDLPAIESKKKRSGEKYIGLEFVKLPDPSLPEK
ncbi:hypothetical protein [Neptuniibacter sp.]|uniref:hypothetical protein n=1 Tax=Neptuniibacter sp. TaxID=1962643 RepID=UPI003B5A4FA6